jgi:hypothetical protein
MTTPWLCKCGHKNTYDGSRDSEPELMMEWKTQLGPPTSKQVFVQCERCKKQSKITVPV